MKMEPVRVVHIASTHRPFDSRIFEKECRSLAEHGYDVTLIVPHVRDEIVDGIRIRAVRPPGSGRERLTKTLGLIFDAAMKEPADAVFHFHDAELIFHMLRLARRGRRVVYDAHEITRLQVLHMAWIPRLARPIIARIMHLAERRGDRRFAGIVGAVPAILEQFHNPRRALIRNFPFTDRYRSDDPTPWNERPAHVIYLGGLTEARGLREMMHAVDLLPGFVEARLRLAGSFHPPTLEREIRGWPGFDRTTFLGWLDSDAIVAELDSARIGIVVLKPTEQYLLSYPTKLFQYMAAGIPVIASDFPVWREIVATERCGILVDPTRPDELADAAGYLLNHPDEAHEMGLRGFRAARRKFDWASEEATLLQFYEKLLSETAPEGR